MSKPEHLPESKAEWRELAQAVEAFDAAWQTPGSAPDPGRYLPPKHAPLRRLTLIELIKVDLHQRQQRNVPRLSLDDYLDRWPELVQKGSVPSDLVFEEIQVRQRAGEPVDFSEYAQRFPEAAVAVARLVRETRSNITTTAMRRMRRGQRFQPGTQLDDFELLAELGQGGFATVYLARQLSMQRLVALKISVDQGEEPQTLAQLDHPHIVRVFDQRQMKLAHADEPQRLLYMQFVPGGTLLNTLEWMQQHPREQWNGALFLQAVDRSLVAQGQSVDEDSSNRRAVQRMAWPFFVARIGRQLASALHYAHQQGVLHRDIKPANVLLTAEGSAKLVDFNVSFCSKVEGASPAAFFGGSLPYMAPEQLEACHPECPHTARDLDVRSDVFSLGVLLYELLAGERPFADPPPAGDWCGVLDMMVEQRQIGLPRARMEAAFEDQQLMRHTLMKCLELLPERRFANAEELANMLAACETPTLGRLLFPRHKTGWLRLFRHVLPWVVLLTVLPSAFAAWFIYEYNLVESLGDTQTWSGFFNRTRIWINAIAFPLAMLWITWLALPIAVHFRSIVPSNQRSGRTRKRSAASRGMGKLVKWAWGKLRRDKQSRGRRSGSAGRESASSLMTAVKRTPLIGHYAATICLVEWSVAGIAFPLTLQLAGAELSMTAWMNFLFSHVLAGLIVGAYSFFAITATALFAWENRLLGQALIERQLVDHLPSLDALSRWVLVYQAVAAVIPLGSVALLVVVGDAENKFALGVLSVASFIGVALTLLLTRKIQYRLSELQGIFSGVPDRQHRPG